jgi:hypothetical protein
VEQRLGVLQVGGLEAFGEPAVDRREQVAGLGAPTLSSPSLSLLMLRPIGSANQAAPSGATAIATLPMPSSGRASWPPLRTGAYDLGESDPIGHVHRWRA